jgi:hypothetical protein
MGISSHVGIVILILVGMTTVIGVIAIAIIETKRADSEKPPAIPSTPQTTANKKKN